MLVLPLGPGHDTITDLVGPLLHDLPPVVGLFLGALAVFWVGCAVVMALGYLLATALVLGLYTIARACVQYVRFRRTRPATSAEHQTHEAQASVIDLDRYRHDRRGTNDTAPNRPDDPA